jgi:hypothetical protein
MAFVTFLGVRDRQYADMFDGDGDSPNNRPWAVGSDRRL